MQYANLNQPQQISAPTTVRPYAEFQTKLAAFMSTLSGAAAAGGAGAPGAGTAGSTGATGSTGAAGSAGATGSTGSTGSSSSVQAYSACLQSAGTDVTKMQSCASLLSGK